MRPISQIGTVRPLPEIWSERSDQERRQIYHPIPKEAVEDRNNCRMGDGEGHD